MMTISHRDRCREPIKTREFAPFPFDFSWPAIKPTPLKDFDAFAKLASEQANLHGVSWRGQANANWPLLSSAFRAEQSRMAIYCPVTGEEDHWKDIPSIGRSVEERLKYASRRLQKAIGVDPHLCLLYRDSLLSRDIHDRTEEYEELLAIGQHHGLCTPLLDVTSSAYVALFFASVDALARQSRNKKANSKIGIWKIPSNLWHFEESRILERCRPALEAAYRQEDLVKNHDKDVKDLHKVTIRNVFPRFLVSPRMAAQQASFVRVYPDMPLDHALSVFFKCFSSGESDCFADQLQLFTLPAENALLYLMQLRKMNISHETLFPDLDGHMATLNLSLDHYDYNGTTDRSRGSRYGLGW
jgi:hypothetical protein